MIDGKNSTLGNKNQLKNNILYGVNSKGEKIEIARNIEVDKEFPISESNHKNKDEVYRSLILSFPDKAEVEQDKFLKIIVKTKVFEQDWDNALKQEKDWFLGGNEELVNRYLENYSSAIGYQSKNSDIQLTDTGSYSYRISTGGEVYIIPSVDYNDRFINEVSKVRFRIRPSGTPDVVDGKATDIINGKLVALLPNGWEYINEDDYKTTLRYYDTNGHYRDIEVNPQMIYDFQNTGKRSLIFELPQLPDRKLNSELNISINLKAVSSTPKGNSTVYGYFAYDNNGQYGYRPIKSPYGGYISDNHVEKDTWDLNNNGDTGDSILVSYKDIQYIPPREVVGVKKVGKTIQSMTLTGTSMTDLGGDIYYGFQAINMQKMAQR